MSIIRRPLRLTAIACLAVLGISSPGAVAQSMMMFTPSFQVRRSLAFQQAAFNSAMSARGFNGGSSFASGFNSFTVPGFTSPGVVNPYASPSTNPYASPYTNPYGASSYLSGGAGGAYGSGYGSSYEDPLAGYLRGTAQVINAEGTALVSVQKADLMREQVRHERLENRRRAFDLYLYERDRTPSAEDDRQRVIKEQLKRSQNDPPMAEITSAVALNTLLADVQKKGDNARGTDIPLDQDVLRHVNVKSPAGRGNPGLLKNEGRFHWPLVFHGPQYQQEREALGELTPLAYEQAVQGQVATTTLESLTEALRRLGNKLRANIKDLTPTAYGEGRRFLNDYADGLALLRRPDAGDYFTGKAARGKTIADLVHHMTKQGLVFAPAVPGDEPAYLAVHRALAAYDSAGTGGPLASGH